MQCILLKNIPQGDNYVAQIHMKSIVFLAICLYGFGQTWQWLIWRIIMTRENELLL